MKQEWSNWKMPKKWGGGRVDVNQEIEVIVKVKVGGM